MLYECDLGGARLSGVDLTRAEFRECDLSSAAIGPARPGGLEELYVPAEHLSMSGCTCIDTAFNKCTLDRAVVAKCKGFDLTFHDCSLVSAGFYHLSDNQSLRNADQGDLFRVQFHSCDVVRNDWSDDSLEHLYPRPDETYGDRLPGDPTRQRLVELGRTFRSECGFGRIDRTEASWDGKDISRGVPLERGPWPDWVANLTDSSVPLEERAELATVAAAKDGVAHQPQHSAE